MIRIPISQQIIEWAKKEIKDFDTLKTNDKFKCSNNWLGLMAERVFSEYMNSVNIKHEWILFFKKGWDEPDYKINGQSIDIKCTFDCQMWVQKPKHDFYIFSRVNIDLKELIVIGFITKKRLERLIKENRIEIVNRQGRFDFVCPISKLKPIEEFWREINDKKKD